jgi:hypothetical protein
MIMSTATFVNILKLTFSKHMGQNLFLCVISFCIGSNVMI